MASKHVVEWHSANQPPTQKPNPEFPKGIVLDYAEVTGASQSCTVDIPYPAECRGIYIVRCQKCGLSIGLTAAGRPDDPRQVILPCFLNELKDSDPKVVMTNVGRRPFEEA